MIHKRSRRGATRSSRRWLPLPKQKRLLTGHDHGTPVTIPAEDFAPSQRSAGWGPYGDTFLRFNEDAFRALDIQPDIYSTAAGMAIRLRPGGRTGAVPLRSGLTGQVAGGLVIKPRFGWAGVGQILHETGWQASPEFVELPMVPGSAREVPAWVMAGPILVRLQALLRSLTPGYREAEETLLRPRGQIVWSKYLSGSFAHGAWHHLPCRFPDLATDPLLRRHIKWALERMQRSLLGAGAVDPVAMELVALAVRLIQSLIDVNPMTPRPEELDRYLTGRRLLGDTLRLGIEAIAWIVDERGLGGGNERTGLPWTLPLERLWESYVESFYRREAARVGGEIKSGRLGETVFPLHWSDPTHRTLGHLVPDIVIKRGSSVQVIDAKYKAHLAEVDDAGWRRLERETREAHRADLHQILAYASLYEANEVIATLVYPLRSSTFAALRQRHRDCAIAELFQGNRRVRLELRGLPFGFVHS